MAKLVVRSDGQDEFCGICFPLAPGGGFPPDGISVSESRIETGAPFFVEPGTWVVQLFGLPPAQGGTAPSTGTVVVEVDPVEPFPVARPPPPNRGIPFGRYIEHLPGDNSVSGLEESDRVEACQYSMAPFDTDAFPGLRLEGRARRVEPVVPPEAVELKETETLPPGVTAPVRGISMMAMWYPIVLVQGFKRPTCRGLDAIGRVVLSDAVLEAWVAACPNETGADTVNTSLKRLVAPLGTMASYRGEVRNHWQNPLLVRAVSGRAAKVDCEDFAWAAVDLMRSLKGHPGVLASKFPQLARLEWSSAEPFLVSGYVYRSGGREAHMWAGLRCGDRYHFVEAVCGPTYAAAGDPFTRPPGKVTYQAVRFFFSGRSGWPKRAGGGYAPELDGGELEVAYDNARKSNLKAKAIDYPDTENVHWFIVSDPAELGLKAAVRAGTPVVAVPSRAAAAPAAGGERDWVAAPPS